MNLKTFLSVSNKYKWYVFGMIFLALATLLTVRYINQWQLSTQKLTINLLLQELKNHQFQLVNLHPMEENNYPSMLPTGIEAVEFEIKAGESKNVNVIVINYATVDVAIKASETIRKLDKKTNRNFGQAYHRGKLFIMIDDHSVKISTRCNLILQTIMID